MGNLPTPRALCSRLPTDLKIEAATTMKIALKTRKTILAALPRSAGLLLILLALKEKKLPSLMSPPHPLLPSPSLAN
jgi:hypothetical protein